MNLAALHVSTFDAVMTWAAWISIAVTATAVGWWASTHD
jgi:hypothetical protein